MLWVINIIYISNDTKKTVAYLFTSYYNDILDLSIIKKKLKNKLLQ